jgi:hypothetical protein
MPDPLWLAIWLTTQCKWTINIYFTFNFEADVNERANEPLILRLILMKKWLEENGY